MQELINSGIFVPHINERKDEGLLECMIKDTKKKNVF